MASVLTKRGKAAKEELVDENQRGLKITQLFINHLDRYHALPEIFDPEIEKAIMEDQIRNIENPKKLNFVKGLPTFSPSSVSKCDRELFYKALKYPKDEIPFYPYQKRWIRNGLAVHAAIQRDLLYAEKHLEKPMFEVARMRINNSPAWEHNLKRVIPFEDLGFQLFGMMDGILRYKPDNSKLGFEFKTKSTTITAIGNYKLKEPQETHVEQVTAYSLLFGLEEFILCYESLAKDSWNKGEEAKPDIKAFYVFVTKEQRKKVLEKFIRVAKAVKDKTLPDPDETKCIFCEWKKQCEKDALERAKNAS